jgi:imidazolonepropionase-like amidohydrolase
VFSAGEITGKFVLERGTAAADVAESRLGSFCMRIARWSVVVALTAMGATRISAQPPTVFVDVSVIPMDRERVLEHQTVIVSGGRITAVGPNARTPAPRDATVIDGRGKFLMPGLGDAHAHLSTVGGGQALAERALTLYALHGVTMIRSMYTEPHHLTARDRVGRGELTGPRTMLVSPPITGQNTPSPEAARTTIQALRTAGYTLGKVMPGLSRATFDTLAVEARKAGLQLVGHIPADVGLSAALAARMTSVEHLDGFLEALISPTAGVSAAQGGFFGFGVVGVIDESKIPALIAEVKASGTVVVPTEYEMELFVSADSGGALAARPEMRYAPQALVAQWTRQKDGFARGAGVTPERASRYRDIRRRLIRELVAADVPVAAGSDAFNMFDVAGTGTFNEIETLVAAGLTPFQALTAATVVVARLMGIENDAGTIAVGKGADLLLLTHNPLADVKHLRDQSGVMVRGRWFSRALLDAELAKLASVP